MGKLEMFNKLAQEMNIIDLVLGSILYAYWTDKMRKPSRDLFDSSERNIVAHLRSAFEVFIRLYKTLSKYQVDVEYNRVGRSKKKKSIRMFKEILAWASPSAMNRYQFKGTEINLESFKEEMNNGTKYKIIVDVLRNNGIDTNTHSTFSKNRVVDAFNQLIKISGLQEYLDRNQTLPRAGYARANKSEMVDNKMIMVAIYPKTLAKNVVPDLLIHKRGKNNKKANFLYLEAKKIDNFCNLKPIEKKELDYDIFKIKCFIDPKGDYHYQYGVILIASKCNKIFIKIFNRGNINIRHTDYDIYYLRNGESIENRAKEYIKRVNGVFHIAMGVDEICKKNRLIIKKCLLDLNDLITKLIRKII